MVVGSSGTDGHASSGMGDKGLRVEAKSNVQDERGEAGSEDRGKGKESDKMETSPVTSTRQS